MFSGKVILKKLLSGVVLCFAIFSIGSINTINAQEMEMVEETLEARVVEVLEEREVDFEGQKQTYQKLELTVTEGSLVNRNIVLENGNIPTVNSQIYKVGDKVMVSYTKDFEGNDLFYITDYIRRDALIFLFIVFALLSIVIGGLWGASSLIGMAYSFLIIFKFILPQILKGTDPIMVAIFGAALIIPVTFYLSHGFHKKTHVAIIGTLLTLITTGILASFFVEITKLTGFASEEAGFLQAETGTLVNMKGLLLAGIIIASLGILDDITISQASVVQELKNANEKLRFRDLASRAMKVGRDHIASLVNTLVLVYAGSALPLLLLFINNPTPFGQVINHEIIADEIVRTLVGSIGLILAVPITTLLAASYFSKQTQSQ